MAKKAAKPVTSGSECSVPGFSFRGPGFEPTQGVTKSGKAETEYYTNVHVSSVETLWKRSNKFRNEPLLSMKRLKSGEH